MNTFEKALLREIRASLNPISEAVEDFTFAVIEPRVPDDPSHRDMETIIHVHGMKRALEKGSVGWAIKKDPNTGEAIPCSYCGGGKYISLRETIQSNIDELQQMLVGMQEEMEITPEGRKRQSLSGKIDLLKNDIDYLDDALDRFEESGKADEKILCPKCSGWEWADIERYKDPETGQFSKKAAAKQPSPWKMFMDWFWNLLEEVGLRPIRHSGFSSEKDIYGAAQPPAKGKAPIGPARHMTIVVDSMGSTNAEVHEDLAGIFEDADMEGLPFKITPFPTEEMVEKYELATGQEKLSETDIEKLERFEEWLNANRGFSVSARVEESRFGEELGLPEYELTAPLDISKLLQRLGGETVPPTTGEPPPREGEWGRYAQSIKGAAKLRRSKRSKKAHKSYMKTPEYYEKYVKPKEKEEALAAAAAKYPGSKYVYWDDYIDHLADVMERDTVSIELAIGKYMDSLDEFPKPFDFDRLDTNQAVRALNILRAIEPDEVDSLVESAAKFLATICESKSSCDLDKIAATVVSDLGSDRANLAYYNLRELKKTIMPLYESPLYREDEEFNTNYAEAENLLDILMSIAGPNAKVIKIIPIDSSAFDTDSPDCWDNIFGEGERLPMLLSESSLVRANAIKVRNFYRTKTPTKTYNALKQLFRCDPAVLAESMAMCWNAAISSRPLSGDSRDAIMKIARKYKVEGLLKNANIQL